jgi:hypothetical protein
MPSTGSPSLPSSISRLASRVSAWKWKVCPTIRTTPACRQAAIIRSHSSTAQAIGFSTKTCLPAAAAASTPSQ